MTKIMNADKMTEISKDVINNLLEDKKEINRVPKLVIITATEDSSSLRYVENKKKLANEFGIEVDHIVFDKNCTNEEVEKEIIKLNLDNSVDGIILQLPVYDHLSNDLTYLISYEKDVDGLTVESKGLLELNKVAYVPCTPLGVILLLETYDIESDYLSGKNVVIVGRGETAGAPMSTLFRHYDANVTLLHSKTSKKDLEFYVKHADIVVSCVGKRHLLKASWFKEDSIIIGVGFEYDEDGKQHLDFEVDKVVDIGKAKLVTNRVNCTGKATVVSLLLNTVSAYINK